MDRTGRSRSSAPSRPHRPLTISAWGLLVAALLAGCADSNVARSPAGTTSTSPTFVMATSPPPTVAATTTTTTIVVHPATTNLRAAPAAPAARPATGSGLLAGRVIAVDPGHNGANGAHTAQINRPVDAGGFQKPCNTTGTADSGFTEAEFNWQTANLVAAALRQRGATVVLTRADNNGWGPCVDQRGLTASENHADALVSIHADGAGPADHGFHIISPTSIAGYTASTSAPSWTFSTATRDALVTAGFSPSNYVGTGGQIKRGDLGTINRAGVPAILIECGNMHNAADLATMRSPAGRQRLADAIASGLATYLAGVGR